jgi:hypothetical protein
VRDQPRLDEAAGQVAAQQLLALGSVETSRRAVGRPLDGPEVADDARTVLGQAARDDLADVAESLHDGTLARPAAARDQLAAEVTAPRPTPAR